MKIISFYPGHLATVVLMDNGQIIAALSQERCDNIKNSVAFPSDASRSLLRYVGWTVEDIDIVVIAGLTVDPLHCYDFLYSQREPSKFNWVFWGRILSDSWVGRFAPLFFYYLRKKRREALAQEGLSFLHNELRKMNLNSKPLKFVDHHLSHARAAYHALTSVKCDQEALIFTLDGGGDGVSATVTRVDKNGKFLRLAETPMNASIGHIYSSTTSFLGMDILTDEHKVMGLAPYAKDKYLHIYKRIFQGVITLDSHNPLKFRSKVNTEYFYEYLVKYAVGERFDEIAASVQHLTESLISEWVKYAIKLTGISRIYTGGGVFMNVKLNQKIQELDAVEKCFFLPSCGDESTPIGAAYDATIQQGGDVKPLRDIYLGASYTEKEITQFFLNQGIMEKHHVVKLENIEEEIARLLAKRKIVARFSGRSEWGARSLGNRAILAHPAYFESFQIINVGIKNRDFWMPFAPSILDTRVHDYLISYNAKKNTSDYMISAYHVTPLAKDELKAAMHQGDYTVRPQVVRERINASYYKLIKKFEQITGIGAVLNTSFNLHGYPMVTTLEQALFTFEKSNLEYMAIESFMIKKVLF